MQVVGVDGCPGGWLAMAYDDEAAGDLAPRVHGSFSELIAAYPDAACIAIDIPIGLVAGTPRPCDLEARRVLGPRRSSVFPAPDPRLLDATTYEEALAWSWMLTGKGISRQTFGIIRKVAEVHAAMTPALQLRVIEVHPEVCFWALAGCPMKYTKSTAQGYEERRALLAAALEGVAIPARADAARHLRSAEADDVLDATVAAWTARRYAERRAGRLTTAPPVGERGLRMEIAF